MCLFGEREKQTPLLCSTHIGRREGCAQPVPARAIRAAAFPHSLFLDGRKETYGNGIGRVDDKVTQGKSESGAGTLDRDAARTAHIAPISFFQSEKMLESITFPCE